MSRKHIEVIQAREYELEKDRGKYQTAKAEAALLGGSKQQESLLSLGRIFGSYRVGDPPEKAIYILAQATLIFSTMIEPLLIVREYEAKAQTVDLLKESGDRLRERGYEV